MSTYHHGNLHDALLDQAVKIIGENGVEGLSLRKAAKDLGVSHAAPMRHFKSKADLLSAIVRNAYQEMTKSILDELASAEETNAITRLNLMARGTIRWAMNNRAKFSVMTNPDVSRFADDGLKTALGDFIKIVSVALTEAQSQGFRQNTSAKALLFYGVGAALGAATVVTDELMRSVLGTPDDEDIIAEIADQIIPLDEV